MRRILPFPALVGLLAALLSAAPLGAEPLIWGVEVEQLEYRIGDEETEVLAWDGRASVGSDELKYVLLSKGEFETDGDVMEAMETQVRAQMPISRFFDAVAGVRLDTPEGPDRLYGVLGVHGLAPQWFEIDADLFVSGNPSARVEAEYELLLTNYVTLTPSLEVTLPFTDDRAIDIGAWGPTMEVGARLSYDLIDKAVAPYVGVHYERAFGETRNIKEAEGKDADALFAVAGLRLMF